MQKNPILLIFSVVVVSIFTADAMGHGRVKREDLKLECDGQYFTAPPEFLDGIAKCTNPECQEACLYDDILKIVNNGVLDKGGLMKWVERTFPDGLIQKAKDAWGKCLEGAQGKLSKDNECKSYEGIKKCARKIEFDVCK